jgi:serine/threonine protein kinase
MTDERRQAIRHALMKIAGLIGAEREAALAEACGDDAALRAEVEAYLRTDAPTSGVLHPPTPDAGAVRTRMAARPPRERAGQSIDRYTLLQPVGEGGFGTVWMAEQREPVKRRVALKIIKLGMDTRQVVARFEAERQALAMMDHPNIAKVFDAGTTESGRPYFVMELVKGLPITEFCDTEGLTTNERLELFITVCNAAQHAHQKGIIHRDIKPSNVLVTLHDGQPVAKVIDFGIAKAIDCDLTEKTLVTELRQFVGTPEYMSPEQAVMGGTDIDTRSDIYSLGVLLYELLTGAPPFVRAMLRRATLDEIQRVIRETEPPRPSTRVSAVSRGQPPPRQDEDRSSIQFIARSRRTDPRTLTRKLRGDLDWIVMKALEKDRARRYQTANGFAEDLGRYLHNEPVTASPPSSTYRLRKLIRRNRGAFAATASVFAVLLLGIAGTAYGLLRAIEAEFIARAQRDEAARQAEISGAVNDFLNHDLLSAVSPSARAGQGRDVMMREVLDKAAARIEEAGRQGGRFADKPSVEARIRETLGLTYRALGDLELAASHLHRALELRERIDDEPGLLARTLYDLGFLSVQQGEYAEAEACYRRAVEIASANLGGDSDTALDARSGLAVALREQDRLEEAEATFLDVLERQTRTLGSDHSSTIVTMGNLANLYQRVGRYDESEALNRTILDTRLERWGEDDLLTLSTLSNLANVVASAGRLEEAGELMQRVLETKQRLLGPDHLSTLNSMNNLGEVNAQLGNWSEAERWHRETLARRTHVLGEDHPRTFSSMSVLGFALAMQGRFEDALAFAARSTEGYRDVLGPEHFLTREGEHRLAPQARDGVHGSGRPRGTARGVAGVPRPRGSAARASRRGGRALSRSRFVVADLERPDVHPAEAGHRRPRALARRRRAGGSERGAGRLPGAARTTAAVSRDLSGPWAPPAGRCRRDGRAAARGRYTAGGPSSARLRSQNPALRYVAKPTHSAYGTNSTPAGVRMDANTAAVAITVARSTMISTRARPGRSRPKNRYDQVAFRASWTVHRTMASRTDGRESRRVPDRSGDRHTRNAARARRQPLRARGPELQRRADQRRRDRTANGTRRQRPDPGRTNAALLHAQGDRGPRTRDQLRGPR